MAAWARAMAARSADELRERVDQAASLLERVGQRVPVGGPVHVRRRLGVGQRLRCATRPMYLQRALPLARELDQRVTLVLLRQHRTRRAPGGRHRSRSRRVPRGAHAQPRARRPARAAQALSGLAAVAAVRRRAGARRAAGGRRRRASLRATPRTPSAARLDATFLEPARTRFGDRRLGRRLRRGGRAEPRGRDRLRPRGDPAPRRCDRRRAPKPAVAAPIRAGRYWR